MDICQRHRVPATFFVTHDTPLLANLQADPLFKLGIHPNFLPGSSHGATTDDVLTHCLALVPEARAMRTHALVQSSPLFLTVADDYPQIETDVSLFLPFHDTLSPTDFFWGDSGRRIVRLPYFWEDDVCATWPGWHWTADPPAGSGLKIFDFHPAYVALNIETLAGYRAVKQALGSRRLYEAQPEDFAPHVHRGAGACTFLEATLAKMLPDRWRRISEIADDWRATT